VRATLQSEARARRDQESAALRGQVTAAVYLARQIGVAIRNAEVFAALGRVEQDRVASGQPIADGLTRLSVAAGTAEMRARLGTLGQDVAAMTQVSRQLGARLNDEVVPTARRRIAELAQDYLSLLTTTARGADRARLGAEAGVVVQQFEARSIGEFGPVAQLVARHLDAVAAGRTLTQEEVLRDLGAPVLAPVRAPPAPAAAPPRR
jgi:hypothetical protein